MILFFVLRNLIKTTKERDTEHKQLFDKSSALKKGVGPTKPLSASVPQ
jgi:hypothetical protein